MSEGSRYPLNESNVAGISLKVRLKEVVGVIPASSTGLTIDVARRNGVANRRSHDRPKPMYSSRLEAEVLHRARRRLSRTVR